MWSNRSDYIDYNMTFRIVVTKLNNDEHERFPFVESVASAIDGAIVELIPPGQGIVYVELKESRKGEFGFLKNVNDQKNSITT